MEKQKVIVDGGRNITFTGKQIAKASSREYCDPYNKPTRWYVLTLYKTKGSKYICERIGYSQWQGEDEKYEGKVCNTEAEVIAYFGLSDAAKSVYGRAGIQHELEVE